MKVKGKSVAPPATIERKLRRDGETIVFKCAPVLDYKEFETICPQPKPPVISRPGKPMITDTKDPEYLRAVDNWSARKSDWMVLKSISATEGLEWDTVDMEDPSTWENYRKELETCFTPFEADWIIGGCFAANFPSTKRQQEALENFMYTEEEDLDELSSPEDVQDSIPSGEPAND